MSMESLESRYIDLSSFSDEELFLLSCRLSNLAQAIQAEINQFKPRSAQRPAPFTFRQVARLMCWWRHLIYLVRAIELTQLVDEFPLIYFSDLPLGKVGEQYLIELLYSELYRIEMNSYSITANGLQDLVEETVSLRTFYIEAKFYRCLLDQLTSRKDGLYG
jgi:hypothetical protein